MLFGENLGPILFHVDHIPALVGGIGQGLDEFSGAFRGRIIGVLAVWVGVVDDGPKARTRIADGGVLEHRMIAVAVAKAYDGSATDRLMDTYGLASFVIDEDLIESFDEHRLALPKFEFGFGR